MVLNRTESELSATEKSVVGARVSSLYLQRPFYLNSNNTGSDQLKELNMTKTMPSFF